MKERISIIILVIIGMLIMFSDIDTLIKAIAGIFITLIVLELEIFQQSTQRDDNQDE